MACPRPTTVHYNGVNIMTYVENHFEMAHGSAIPSAQYGYRYCVFGIAIKWGTNPSNEKVASLHLCHDSFCVIIQLHHLHPIPDSLKSFLADSCVTFLGASAKEDLLQLRQDYGLEFSSRVVHDLLPLADTVYGFKDHFNIGNTAEGMERLAREIFGIVVEKPDRSVTRSDWGMKFPTAEQIKYATIDAYLSFFIGSNLLASKNLV